MFDKVQEIATRHGLMAAIKFSMYRVGQRLIVLDIQHLMRLSCADISESAGESLIIQRLCRRQLQAIVHENENDLNPTTVDRIDQADNYCFGAIMDGEIAGYAWFATKSIPAEHNRGNHSASGVGLEFPRNVAFMYKAFVMPEFRGRGVYRDIIVGAATELRECNGVEDLICTTDWTNYSALHSCIRSGFATVGVICRFGLPKKMFTSFPHKARRYGIRLI
ncbi:GNAT family N-acetyltransferase [Planctomycetota bacterium]